LVPEIIKFFVNHVQKFKCQAKIMSYAKVDCSQFKSRRLKVKFLDFLLLQLFIPFS